MLRLSIIGSLACLSTLSYASPIGNPSDSPNSPEKRNILVPGGLIPTSTVNPATWPTAVWTGTPQLAPTSLVNLATDSVDKRDVSTIPDLVPTSTVDLATDSTGTGTITVTRDLVPTKVVKLGGITTGCDVSISEYTSGTKVGVSYITNCSDGATAATAEAAASITGISACCGGEDDLYACGDNGAMPTGTIAWTCTFDGTFYAGVASATTSWR